MTMVSYQTISLHKYFYFFQLNINIDKQKRINKSAINSTTKAFKQKESLS